MTTALAFEHKYRMVVDGRVTKLPYTLAKKATEYPAYCVSEWHAAAGQTQRIAVIHSNLCEDCKDILRRSWSTMAENWTRLQDALQPTQSFGNGDRISGAANLYPPLPIDITVSDLLRDIRDAVSSTVDCLIQDRPDWNMPNDPTTDVLAGQLAKWQVEYISTHPSQRHSWVVLKEAYEISLRIERQSDQIPPAEVMTNSLCHKYTEDATGSRVPCPGQIAGVQQRDGRRIVQCTHDPDHTMPIEVWLQVSGQRATHKRNIAAGLMRKYAKRRADV